ncbi:MAG TPA: hypothetical protein VE503_07985, partial [Ornithinibacter sp.]|nr:hypothetical protein [Ornithinibacter sp.]
RQRLLSEVGGGIVVVDGEDVGTWKRTVGRAGVRVAILPDVALPNDDLEALEKAAQALAAFLERPLELEVPNA